MEIGNRNNERGESDYVELVGKYYCSCFSWSFRSQSLEEREEPLVAADSSCGSECHYALSRVIYCSSCISGAPVSHLLCKDLLLSQARLGWSAGNCSDSEQHVLFLKCDFYLTRATGSSPAAKVKH